MTRKVRMERQQDQLIAADSTWLSLGELRQLVHQADQAEWPDNALVSHSVGRDHPNLRHMQITTRIIVEGPA